MERVLTTEEKIRRAEEIYQRRRAQVSGVRVATAKVNVSEKHNFGLLKKMLLQIVICLLIYFIFYLIQNTNYIFSADVINRAKEILSYDINFQSIYNSILEYINKPEEMENGGIGGASTEEQNQNTIGENRIENTNAVLSESENLVTENTIPTEEPQNPTSSLSQMELDANDVKARFEFIKPVQGTITSRFGMRDPTTPTVPKNHTGLDIGANTGTTIIAAIDGTVSLASSEGDYGNHLKITNGDIMTVYAHCSKLLVKEGDSIKQGDKIAEVGETGNVTGPHLHFEIRKEDRYIDPEYILTY